MTCSVKLQYDLNQTAGLPIHYAVFYREEFIYLFYKFYVSCRIQNRTGIYRIFCKFAHLLVNLLLYARIHELVAPLLSQDHSHRSSQLQFNPRALVSAIVPHWSPCQRCVSTPEPLSALQLRRALAVLTTATCIIMKSPRVSIL